MINYWKTLIRSGSMPKISTLVLTNSKRHSSEPFEKSFRDCYVEWCWRWWLPVNGGQVTAFLFKLLCAWKLQILFFQNIWFKKNCKPFAPNCLLVMAFWRRQFRKRILIHAIPHTYMTTKCFCWPSALVFVLQEICLLYDSFLKTNQDCKHPIALLLEYQKKRNRLELWNDLSNREKWICWIVLWRRTKKETWENSLSNNRIRCRVSGRSRDISDQVSDEIRANVIRQASAFS